MCLNSSQALAKSQATKTNNQEFSLMRSRNLNMRLNFARSYINWSGTEELKYDETKINLFGNDTKRNVRRPEGKEFYVRFTKKL